MKNKNLALTPEVLYHACDASTLAFNTTDELDTSREIIGQSRALEALDFGVGIKHDGYNLFVTGSAGLGKHTIVKKILETKKVDSPKPSDWCYINNFKLQHNPNILELPAGYGNKLRNDMKQLVEDLLAAIPAAFETDKYHARVKEIQDELTALEKDEFTKLDKKSVSQNIALVRTPGGYTLSPMRDNKVLTPQEFKELSDGEKEDIKKKTDEIEKEINAILRKVPIWERETRKQLKLYNREVTRLTVEQFIDELREKYSELPYVLNFINDVENEIIEDVDAFLPKSENVISIPGLEQPTVSFTQYEVNVLVDNRDVEGAPVIYEDNPTYNNLMGRIERVAQYGTLFTNFTLIKAGALHRANGGFLIVDAHRLLTSPFAYEGLKRALRAQEVRIESLEKMLSVTSTTSLEPDPIPIDLKVIITGDRWLYYLLKRYDPEFNQLFKVTADFAEEIDRDSENTFLYARLIATFQHEQKLKAFDQKAVALIIEDCSRKIEDAEKISLHLENLLDLLRESDYYANQEKHEVVQRADVQLALDARIRRLDQYRELVHEQVLRGTYLLDTEGNKIAQINGLSIIQLDSYSFGRPSKITATARLGSGKVIDIEREVELGGSIHSKGVLILSSFLANRYAHDQPLSLSASLVFEQSYGMVEGDSASVAELCALLSALAKLPIDQSFAVTGSVNQLGQVQPIGGVNEKIEGFFDICKARGLTGSQAVIIPASNVKHLMLRNDVVNAVKEKQFNVYAVEIVDQVIELLTGKTAGKADDNGIFPDDSVNGLVQNQLIEMTRKHQQYAKEMNGDNNEKNK
jgi:lon-related putative ATP-dependent protease